MGELRMCEDTYATIKAGSTQEGADVFADSFGDGDVEAAIGGDIECGAFSVVNGIGGAIKGDIAGSGDDFHALGRGSAEMVFTGVDQSNRFFRSVSKVNAVGDDFAIEIDIRFGIDSNIGEFGRLAHGVRFL